MQKAVPLLATSVSPVAAGIGSLIPTAGMLCRCASAIEHFVIWLFCCLNWDYGGFTGFAGLLVWIFGFLRHIEAV